MSSANRFTPQENTKEKSNEKVETDFLDVDRPIPGQSFVCMSFLSPETAIKERYLWYVKKFLEDLTISIQQPENMPELEFKTKLQQIVTKKVNYKGISNLWEDFLYSNNEKLDKEYNNDVDFRTSVRGIKIRGSYDNYREAKNRSDQIAKFDKNHHVYIGQIGYWLPWDPDPHEVSEQEYQEKDLNTLMSKYRENLVLKDQFFEERNREKMDQALKENKLAKKVDEKNKKILNNVRKIVGSKDKIFNEDVDEKRKKENTISQSITSSDTEYVIDDLSINIINGDIDNTHQIEDEVNITTPNNSVCSINFDSQNDELFTDIISRSNDLSNSIANITDVFETIDPWLQNKNINK